MSMPSMSCIMRQDLAKHYSKHILNNFIFLKLFI